MPPGKSSRPSPQLNSGHLHGLLSVPVFVQLPVGWAIRLAAFPRRSIGIPMTPYPVSKQMVGFFGWLFICFSGAALGGLASAHAGSFYRVLARPHWAPPAWLFGPVWTFLYILMAIAAWLIWRENGFRKAGIALSLFLVQLAANALWTWLFFVWHQGMVAFVEIMLLWALILATAFSFWRVRPIAGILLLPYLAWVSFASALTWAVWKGNPHLLT